MAATLDALLSGNPSMPLDEDAWLRLQVARYDPDGGAYYFSECSTAQCLRLLSLEAQARLTSLAAMEDGKWFGLDEASGVNTVSDVLALVAQPKLQLIDIGIEVGGVVRVDSHDDGEVTVSGLRGEQVRDLALAILDSRGLAGEALVAELERHPKAWLEFGEDSAIRRVHASFESWSRS